MKHRWFASLSFCHYVCPFVCLLVEHRLCIYRFVSVVVVVVVVVVLVYFVYLVGRVDVSKGGGGGVVLVCLVGWRVWLLLVVAFVVCVLV